MNNVERLLKELKEGSVEADARIKNGQGPFKESCVATGKAFEDSCMGTGRLSYKESCLCIGKN